MLEIEVLGRELTEPPLPVAEIERLCALTLQSAGIRDGHLAVEFVFAERITELNREFRGKAGPTDVLSFPIDELVPLGNDSMPRELGDIVICPAHTVDLREAIVHGTLHLIGIDHETDDGEMLALQDDIMRGDRP